MRETVLFGLVAVAVLGAAAYLYHRPPFQTEVETADAHAAASANMPASATTVECSAYSVFIDPTSSTTDRVNYTPEMVKFRARLHSCDSVRVGRIADRTSDEAWVLPWTELPTPDPNGGADDDTDFKMKYQGAKHAVMEAVNHLLQEESPARSTDVLGLLSRLSPAPNKRNVLVVASDGLDTATIENACITNHSIQGLLDKAAERLRGRNALAGFSEVFWVMPTKAGRTACNSLREQRLFWPTILEAEAAPGKLDIHFDTNPL